MKTLLPAIIFSLLLTLGGCREQTPAQSGGKPVIVATTSQVRDMVAQIVGDGGEVVGLMGPGVDPHLYKPTAGDVQKLESADIIVYSGLELEGRMGEILEKAESGGRTVISASEGIPEDRLIPLPQIAGHHDPHFWFDPELWQLATQHVADELAEASPTSKDTFQTNASTFITKLKEMDQRAKEMTGEIPKERRILITAHDAFGYFGRRYGFEIHGIQGTSTVSEAGAGDLQRLANLIAQKKIKAMFVETSVPKATIEALQKAVQSRGWEIKIGGSLYSDAMGSEGTDEGTYLGMFDHNVQTIVEALR